MDIRDADRIKHRLIPFSELHPDDNQAQTAAMLLADMTGVLRAEPISALALQVSYDVLATTLLEIEEAIRRIGLHLDRNLMYRLKSALGMTRPPKNSVLVSIRPSPSVSVRIEIVPTGSSSPSPSMLGIKPRISQTQIRPSGSNVMATGSTTSGSLATSSRR